MERKAHFSNMVVPFLHANPHFHSLLHEARGHDNGVRLPCHRCGNLLNRHLDQMSIRARVVESIGFTNHDGSCGREVSSRLNFWSGDYFSVPRLARDALNVQERNL
jgi:hypothetical protein